MAEPFSPAPRRPRTLALELVESLGRRIRDGLIQPGDKLPTEAAIMGEFGVSRTVVREAISKLQAAGLVETRHGIGTFVVGLGDAGAFRIAPEQMATLHDVIAVLELRIGLETEAAALAAQRRTAQNLAVMREALAGFAAAVAEGRDAVGADFQFHLEVARATQNPHFTELMATLGTQIIPRARLHDGTPTVLPMAAGTPIATAAAAESAATGTAPPPAGADEADDRHRLYLVRANAEHQNIFDAIENQDPDGARAAMRTHLASSRERRRRAAAAAEAAQRQAPGAVPGPASPQRG